MAATDAKSRSTNASPTLANMAEAAKMVWPLTNALAYQATAARTAKPMWMTVSAALV